MSTINPPGKELIAQAERDGHKTVVLMISVHEGASEAVSQALRELGATVEVTDPSIGYVRAEVPIDKVKLVPGLKGVSKVDVDEPLSNRDPEP